MITEVNAEDLSQHQRGFAAGKSKRDVKGQDQADDVEALMNTVQIDERAVGSRRG